MNKLTVLQTVTSALVETRLARSLREAQRLIIRGDVRVNDRLVLIPDAIVDRPATLSVGPRRSTRLT
jgi:ribosomal protein S4